MPTTDKLNQAEIARVQVRRPLTVGEMCTPYARRIRRETLAEVIDVINKAIADRIVAIEDEAYFIRHVVEREWERLQD